jgi:hypothetical protein
LWAWARYDFGLQWSEFEELTPGEFNELGKRRNVRIRYDRYANAITASAVYNCNRGSGDDPIVGAFDFIRPEEDAIKLEKTRETKRWIKKVIGQLPMDTPRVKFLDIRIKAIADLKTSGHADPEALFDSVWPHLRPTKEESNT